MSTLSSPGRIARGGKSLYGAPLGILMLDARFPRILGDMGNGQTWPFPVLYRVVRGASPEKVVLQGARGTLGISTGDKTARSGGEKKALGADAGGPFHPRQARRKKIETGQTG